MPNGVSIVFGIAMPAKPGLGHASSFTFTVSPIESASPQARKMETIQHSCQCPCGTNQFSAVGEPIVRFFCHCTICQDKYQAPFADVTLFKLPAVRLPEQATTYGKYKRFAAIDRGICDACHKPVMAKMQEIKATPLSQRGILSTPASCRRALCTCFTVPAPQISTTACPNTVAG